MKIPVHVRVFPGSEQERVDLVAAVRRYCACQNGLDGDLKVNVVNDVCPPHDLLGQESNVKRLVFYRRWHRARRDAL